MTIAFISEAIKKLRGAYAQQHKDSYTATKQLWRGMKDMELTGTFTDGRKGGTVLWP